jgi:hypothetical protein
MARLRAAHSANVLAFCLFTAIEAFAGAAPTSIPQLALYQGADREKISIEGAKREGPVTFYKSFPVGGFNAPAFREKKIIAFAANNSKEQHIS